MQYQYNNSVVSERYDDSTLVRVTIVQIIHAFPKYFALIVICALTNYVTGQ